ncbi:hypothetical protein NZK33_08340 [Cyanobium sp. FGCU-6]|nr:hypothetical protein [Cyanobium sp. FGCU6]
MPLRIDAAPQGLDRPLAQERVGVEARCARIPQVFPTAAGYLLPALALLLLAEWVCQRLEVLALGRAMAAVREDELAAPCMGIATTRVKLSAFLLSAVLGGLLLTALPELLRPVGDVRLVLFGLVILLGPALFPQGLVTPALLERLGRWGEGSRP